MTPTKSVSPGSYHEAAHQAGWLWVIVALVLVPVMLTYARFAIVEPIQNWQSDDLAINYSAANVLRSGGFVYDSAALRAEHAAHIGPPGNLYQVLFLTYNNTPVSALVHWPLTFLAYPTAKAVFVLLGNALYLTGIALTLYMLRANPLAVILSVIVCTVLFFYAVRQTFGLGQMNGALVFLMAVALAFALKQRDAWSGSFIVLAGALKISPIVMLGFFIAQRRWRAVLGATVTGIGLLAVMVLFTGWNTVMYFVTQILPAVGRGSAAFPNQSLLGALYRLSVPLSVIRSTDVIGDYPVIRAVWVVCAIGVLALTLWIAARAQLASRSQIAVGLSVFIAAGLLAGGLAWEHYLMWLTLPAIVLLIDWFQRRWLRAVAFWPLFLLSLMAIGMPIGIQDALYHSIGPLGSSLSTYGLIGLWLLMLWRMHRLRHRQTVAVGNQ